MAFFNKLIGENAEKEARIFLQTQGLRFIEKNFFCSYGELDLIMRDQNQLVFVEVRSRNQLTYGEAIETITHTKIQKLIRSALFYLKQKNWLNQLSSRFDIVGIHHHLAGEKRLRWIKDAFPIEP